MGSIPLVALMGTSTTHLVQPDNILSDAEKAQQISAQRQLLPGQLQTQSIQNLLGQQQVQEGALRLADQQAMNAAMKAWDGKDMHDLPSLVQKNGGSANAVLGLKSNLVQYDTNVAKMTADQLANESTKNDAIAGHIDAIKGLDPAQQPQAFEAAKADLVKNNYMTPQEAQSVTYPGPEGLDNLEKMYQSHSAQVANALKAAEAAQKSAQAVGEKYKVVGDTLYDVSGTTPKPALGSIKPDEMKALVDQVVPPTGRTADLNRSTKSQVNFYLMQGNLKAAEAAITAAQNHVVTMGNEEYTQNAENMRQASNRAAMFGNELQKNGLNQLDKVFTDPQHGYAQVLAQANLTKSDIQNAKDGSELAAAFAPVMTILGVNSFAGMHRVSPAEPIAFANAGSLYRRLNTMLDKATAGEMNPDTAKEAVQLVDALIQAKHASLVGSAQMVAQNAGLDPKKTMILDSTGKMDTLDSVAKKSQQAASGPTNPQGHKVGDVITQNGHNFIATAVDASGKVTAARPQ